MLRKLPVDFKDFPKIRRGNYLYVDKTRYAYELITGGHYFFLSRPRRFGKSLFVSTLHAILTAQRELFDGLWIVGSDYEWREHGVILLDFSMLEVSGVTEFRRSLCSFLAEVAHRYQLDIAVDPTSPETALRTITTALHQRFGCVAILIDEYDSPILHTLKYGDLAHEMRDTLSRFFAVIKGLDTYLDFVFITGVSAFAKAGLFSGINNLQIITLERDFAGICGYTDQEVDQYFTAYIEEWSTNVGVSYESIRHEVREWYNGYRFGAGVPAVYSPFSLMKALKARELHNFWIQSATPKFLVEELAKESRRSEHRLLQLEDCKISRDSLGIFEIGATPLPTLLFQSGYLTVTGYDTESKIFSLGYPNTEVRVALEKYLLEVLTTCSAVAIDQLAAELKASLISIDIEQFSRVLQRAFAHIPYSIQIPEEKFYHALLQMACSIAGLRAQSEYSTSHARIDMVIEFAQMTYVVEVKFNKTAQEALEQIWQRRYYEKFAVLGKKIILLGLAFKRQPQKFEVAAEVQVLDAII